MKLTYKNDQKVFNIDYIDDDYKYNHEALKFLSDTQDLIYIDDGMTDRQVNDFLGILEYDLKNNCTLEQQQALENYYDVETIPEFLKEFESSIYGYDNDFNTIFDILNSSSSKFIYKQVFEDWEEEFFIFSDNEEEFFIFLIDKDYDTSNFEDIAFNNHTTIYVTDLKTGNLSSVDFAPYKGELKDLSKYMLDTYHAKKI